MREEVLKGVHEVYKSTFPKAPPFAHGIRREQVHGWDSLQHIHFLVGLEERFSVRFDGAAAARMVSIAAVVEEVEKRVALLEHA